MSESLPEPFVIDANTIYPFAWLERRLVGIISLSTLLDRTGLRAKRKFRDAILGSELLDALARVEPYAAEAERPAALVLDAARGGRRRGGRVERKTLGNGAVARLTSKPFEP